MVEPRVVVDALFAEDTASRVLLGIEVVEVSAGGATVSMVVRDDMTNGFDVCHGGLIFTLADTAMAFASNGANENALAAGAAVDFLNPARAGDILTAVAREQSLRGRSGIYDASVTNGEGLTVALFRGRTRRVGGTIVDL